MGHDTRFTWPRRCDAHLLLPATRDCKPARPFAMLTGEPLRPWQVCDVTRTTFSSHRRAPKALQIDRQHTTTSSPSTCRRTTGNGLRVKPGTYTVGPETIGATDRGETIDPAFADNSSVEWYSANSCKGSIILHGLLLRVAPANESSPEE